MRLYIIFIVSCILAGLVPVINEPEKIPTKAFHTSLPTHFKGHLLKSLPLTDREKTFQNEFPGQIARFSDGSNEIIFRVLQEPTRKLHPSSNCFKANGYSVQPRMIHRDDDQYLWSCFESTRGSERFLIYERIYDERGHSWTDVSSWYWSAMFGKTNPPWYAVTVATKSASL